MYRIKWLNCVGDVYGEVETEDVIGTLTLYLRTDWKTFGSDGDEIVIEEVR